MTSIAPSIFIKMSVSRVAHKLRKLISIKIFAYRILNEKNKVNATVMFI